VVEALPCASTASHTPPFVGIHASPGFPSSKYNTRPARVNLYLSAIETGLPNWAEPWLLSAVQVADVARGSIVTGKIALEASTMMRILDFRFWILD
jgi:hypothetical protein